MIVPGERVKVTNRLIPRDQGRGHVPYEGIPNDPIAFFSDIVDVLAGLPVMLGTPTATQAIDTLLWKGGWPSE